MLDDGCRETVAAVGELGHAFSVPESGNRAWIAVTMPPEGIVTLPSGDQQGANADFASHAADGSFPMRHRFGSEGSQGRAGDEVALQVEGVVDGGMEAEKSLCGADRLEPLYLALLSSHNLMQGFGTNVFL